MELEVMDRAAQGLAQGGRAWPVGRTQILSNASGIRGGDIWPGKALPQ